MMEMIGPKHYLNLLTPLVLFFALNVLWIMFLTPDNLLAVSPGIEPYLASLDAFAFLAHHLLNVLFFGWFTHIIVQNTAGNPVNAVNSIKEIRYWFHRSLLIYATGRLGFGIIAYTLTNVSSDTLFAFVMTFIGGLWITITYAFYPIVFADDRPILVSILKAPMISMRSASKWFLWFLLLLVISGFVVYVWIPSGVASRFMASRIAIFEWFVHLEWIGGYSFTSNWYIDYAKSLNIIPSNIVLAIFFCINSLIATLIKIKVTRILFEDNYLPVTKESGRTTAQKISNSMQIGGSISPNLQP